MRIKPDSSPDVDATLALLRALSDPVRLRLVNLLAGREVCVCHLHEALELPQPTVSRHLAYLRRAGLATGRKQGLWVHYRLTTPTGELDRGIVAALTTGLASAEQIRADRERLDRLTCC